MVQGVDFGPVPSRRRIEEARQARGRARRGRRARDRLASTRRSRRSARRPNGAQWLDGLEGRARPLVQLHLGQRLLFRRQILDRASRHSARLHQGLHRPAAHKAKDIDRPTATIAAERERITAEYAELLPAKRKAAFERQARPRAHRLPLCREPQLLHRALVDERVLAQDARAQRCCCDARASGAKADDMFYPLPPGGARRPVRLRQRLGGRRGADRARNIGPPRSSGGARSCGRARHPAAAARAQRAAGGDHRTVHDHALGHHDRTASRRWLQRRRQCDDAHGMAASPGVRRGPRARHPFGRRTRPGAGGRNPRHAGHGAELGAGVRQDQGDRHRHRRHDVPCRDRLPRIWLAGGDRHGQSRARSIKTRASGCESTAARAK